tara:strand:+ start:2113 stop:3066 length:954 start_codon:yes stop_codon:yes gene_type:complete
VEITASEALLQRKLAMRLTRDELKTFIKEELGTSAVEEGILDRTMSRLAGAGAGTTRGSGVHQGKMVALLKAHSKKFQKVADGLKSDSAKLKLEEDETYGEAFRLLSEKAYEYVDLLNGANAAISSGQPWPPESDEPESDEPEPEEPTVDPDTSPATPTRSRETTVARQGMRTFFSKSTDLNNLQASKLAAAVEKDLGIVREGREPKEMPKTVEYILALPVNLQQSAIKGVINWLKSTEFALGRESSVKLKQGHKPDSKKDQPLDLSALMSKYPKQNKGAQRGGTAFNNRLSEDQKRLQEIIREEFLRIKNTKNRYQ